MNENVYISIKLSLKLLLRAKLTNSNIGSNNGLVPTRRQTIIWTTDGYFTDTYMGHSAPMSHTKSWWWKINKLQCQHNDAISHILAPMQDRTFLYDCNIPHLSRGMAVHFLCLYLLLHYANQLFCSVSVTKIHYYAIHMTLQWRHNGHDGVSNHHPHDCWLFIQPFIRVHIKDNIKVPRLWSLCEEFTGPRAPVNSPQKGPVTRKMFLFDDVIMILWLIISTMWLCV